MLLRWVGWLCCARAMLWLAQLWPKFGSQSRMPRVSSIRELLNPVRQSFLQLDSNPSTAVLDAVSDVLIHIYDSAAINGVPVNSIGKVTLEGESNGVGRVRLLVAGASLPSFPVDPSADIFFPGCVNFTGGVETIPPPATTPYQYSLLYWTEVAVAVTGEIAGEIRVGSVFRLQANNPASPTPSGTISANITADRSAFYDSSVDFAIRTISDANAITGTIETIGPAFDDVTAHWPANIDRVVVGTSSLAQGIRGNIISQGNINHIFSTGDIGTPANPVTISAGDRISEIRTREQTQLDPSVGPSNKNIYANIKAGAQYYLPSPINGERFRRGVSYDAGSLIVVETGGNLKGSIEAMNLGHEIAGNVDFRTNDGREGIIVRGTLDAPVSIWGGVNVCDIIAAKILQPIYIGYRSKGAIVAYGEPTAADPLLGSMKSVSIDRVQPANVLYSDAFGSPFGQGPSGFIGTEARPLDLAPNEPISGLARSAEAIWFSPPNPDQSVHDFDNGARESVIRAKSCDSIQIGQMHQNWLVDNTKEYKPRIEVEQLGSLFINQLVTGVIWSGKLEYAAVPDPVTGTYPTANNPANDFASIGQLTIGCMGPTADVYVKDCLQIEITGSMHGELHMPQLAAAGRIRIGDRLNASSTATESETCIVEFLGSLPYPWNVTRSDEQSPRGKEQSRDVAPGLAVTDESTAARGSIVFEGVTEPTGAIKPGLAGQIIINSNSASNDPQNAAANLQGVVKIVSRAYNPSNMILSDPVLATYSIDAAAAATRLASYAARNSALGGGAIGLVPFGFHPEQCLPPVSEVLINNHPVGNPFSRETLLTATAKIQLAFYGPLQARVDSAYVDIAYRPWSSTFDAWESVNTQFLQSLSPTRREIVLSANPSFSTAIKYGFYRATLRADVLSAETTNLPPVVGSGSGLEYYFKLTCGAGGRPNPADVAGGHDDNAPGVEFPDGVVDGADFIAFINAFASGDPLADIAGDFLPNDNPLIPPTFAPDGIIDGTDFIEFINGFTAGCET